MTFYVIGEEALDAALRRVADGDDPAIVLAEVYANCSRDCGNCDGDGCPECEET